MSDQQPMSGAFSADLPDRLPEVSPSVAFEAVGPPIEPMLVAWPARPPEPQVITWSVAPSGWDHVLHISDGSAPFEIIVSAYDRIEPESGRPAGIVRRDKCGRGAPGCPTVRGVQGIAVDIGSLIPVDASFAAVQLVWTDPAIDDSRSEDRFLVLTIQRST